MPGQSWLFSEFTRVNCTSPIKTLEDHHKPTSHHTTPRRTYQPSLCQSFFTILKTLLARKFPHLHNKQDDPHPLQVHDPHQATQFGPAMPKVPLAILPVVFLIRQGIVLPHALKQRRGAPLRRSAPTRAPLQRLAPHLRKPAGNGGKNWDVTQKNEDVAPKKNWLQGLGV